VENKYPTHFPIQHKWSIFYIEPLPRPYSRVPPQAARATAGRPNTVVLG